MLAIALIAAVAAIVALTAVAESGTGYVQTVEQSQAYLTAPLDSGAAGVSAAPSLQEDGDEGPDILLEALLTIAVAGGAALLGLLGYLFRRAIGFDLHRPPPEDETPH